jgi:hypothetical protein
MMMEKTTQFKMEHIKLNLIHKYSLRMPDILYPCRLQYWSRGREISVQTPLIGFYLFLPQFAPKLTCFPPHLLRLGYRTIEKRMS